MNQSLFPFSEKKNFLIYVQVYISYPNPYMFFFLVLPEGLRAALGLWYEIVCPSMCVDALVIIISNILFIVLITYFNVAFNAIPLARLL